MKEFKGTKGEWYTVEYAGMMSIQNGPSYEDDNILDIDIVCKEQFYANAKLIAAAPELLQLAIDTLNLCSMLKMPNESQLIELEKKCEAAINKALS